ncbi:MAG: hypothetical protein HKN09_07985 [Saprospiraceae bacterium]|nr:hypothetical protein [Saprospiraceae bacterium]
MKNEQWLLSALTVVAIASVASAIFMYRASTAIDSSADSNAELIPIVSDIRDAIADDGDPGDDLPDGVTETSGSTVASWISNYYNWQASNETFASKAFSLNGTTLIAINIQSSSPVSGQVSTRVYYGLRTAVEAGEPAPYNLVRTIVMPVDGDGNDIFSTESSYYTSTVDSNAWRPCPPYCDAARGSRSSG